MTTTDQGPRPQCTAGASMPGRSAPAAPRWVTKPTREGAAAATSRMLLDDHRSQNGQCVRFDSPWPCGVIRSVRSRRIA